jgi:tetratricopeptide (TPR) repeat protein
MKKLMMLQFLLVSVPAVAQQQCDCLYYPFNPAPPCPEVCFRKIVHHGSVDIAQVKNLDPGVAVHLKLLASSPDRLAIDFSNINSKSDLESLSLESIEDKIVYIQKDDGETMTHSEDGHAKELLRHAMESLKNAKAAEGEHAEAQKHMTEAVKQLEEAIEHAEAQKHVTEAVKQLEEAIEHAENMTEAVKQLEEAIEHAEIMDPSKN